MSDLPAEYERMKREAEVLAGGLTEIPRRVSILTHLYHTSGRNHTFPLIAAHGALWAIGYFETGGSLGRLIAWRYFYSSKERAYRIGILREFAESFRRVNRQVCIDTLTNYNFTRKYGERSGADELIPASLLDALNRIHHANRDQTSLNPDEKRNVFEQSFRCEQEYTVAPGVAKAVSEFDCRIMRWLCLHPIVRFTFFPRMKYIFFRDFASKDERIEKGLLTYDLAERRGWKSVYERMQHYGQMPNAFFKDSEGHYQSMYRELLKSAAVARGMSIDGPESTEE